MKNMKGLKGTTDALTHCKSMYASGGSAGKNQILRMGGSYELGGMTAGLSVNDTCGPGDGGCHKSRRRANNQRLKSAGVSRSNRRRMS